MSIKRDVKNAAVVSAVQTAINRLTRDGKPFTHYDVVSLVRDSGLRVKYAEIRNMIKRSWSSGNISTSRNPYVRSACVLNSGDQARVYHPQYVQAETHPYVNVALNQF